MDSVDHVSDQSGSDGESGSRVGSSTQTPRARDAGEGEEVGSSEGPGTTSYGDASVVLPLGDAGPGPTPPSDASSRLQGEFLASARDRSVSVKALGPFPGVDLRSATFSWDFNGDGLADAFGQIPPAHEFETDGAKVVSLRVSDGALGEVLTERVVDVMERAPGEIPPGPSNTGLPHILDEGADLLIVETALDGALRVTKPGEDYELTLNGAAHSLPEEHAWVEAGGSRLVLDRLLVRGYIDIAAPNVTLTRSVVEGLAIPQDATYGRRMVRAISTSATNFVLSDTTIRVPAAASASNSLYHHSHGIDGRHFTALRVDISGTIDGMQVFYGSDSVNKRARVVVSKSWIHDMKFALLDYDRSDDGPSHSDAIQLEGANREPLEEYAVQIVGNTLDMTAHYRYTSAIMITDNVAGQDRVLIANNWIDGATCSINVASGTSTTPIYLAVAGNRFGPNRANENKTGWDADWSCRIAGRTNNVDPNSANFVDGGINQYVYVYYDEAYSLGSPSSNYRVSHTPSAFAWGTDNIGPVNVSLF